MIFLLSEHFDDIIKMAITYYPTKKQLADQHQDYCDVCQAGGEIILCDTCPKAFHLVCLEPELEEAPEGEWYCPHCEKDGTAESKRNEKAESEAKAAVDADGIVHLEFCGWCKDGGELICCESCPQSYHIECVNPPLTKTPASAWICAKCECEKPAGVVKKVLNWRWKVFDVPEGNGTEYSLSSFFIYFYECLFTIFILKIIKY